MRRRHDEDNWQVDLSCMVSTIKWYHEMINGTEVGFNSSFFLSIFISSPSGYCGATQHVMIRTPSDPAFCILYFVFCILYFVFCTSNFAFCIAFQVMIRTPSDPGIPYVHEIRSVSPSDTGMYTCVARNVVGRSVTSNAMLQ